MTTTTDLQNLRDIIDKIAAMTDEAVLEPSGALPASTQSALSALLTELNPAEVAHVLEGLPTQARTLAFHCVPVSYEGEVLLQIGEVAAADLAEQLDVEVLKGLAEEMDSSDVAELLDVLPEESVEDLLESMSAQRRARIEANLSYEEDSAGRLMQSDAVSIRADVRVETVLRYLRQLDDIPDDTLTLMVVSRDGFFRGVVKVLDLLRTDPDARIDEIMDTDIDRLHPTDSDQDVAILFETHDLIAAPVVSEDGIFLGRVVIDDVVDLIREQGEQAFFSQAGLDDEEDLFGPMLPSARRRAVWLALNLLTALLTAWVIGLFETTLDQVVALAILMPIVASMGGIAATQTMTLTIRGLALRQIGRSNVGRLLNKEAGISLINGVLWALVVGVIAGNWFSSTQIGLVIGAAMVINMMIGAMVGVSLPVLLERMRLDPALSGAVIVTTVTDVVGFVVFLGLASLYLL